MRKADSLWHLKCSALPSEAGPFFELFFRKKAPLQSASIETTGFSRSVQLRFHLEKSENGYRKIYMGSHFRHSFLIKPVSFPVCITPQIGQATCMPVASVLCFISSIRFLDAPIWILVCFLAI